MALALIVLALGSVAAGYAGLPRALGGSNWFERFLEPSFAGVASHRAERMDAGTGGVRLPPDGIRRRDAADLGEGAGYR